MTPTPTGLALTREVILTYARTLPAAPQVLAGLCELLQDINSGLDQIAEQIRRDPALAARVIRISNSPVFGGGGRVGSVDDAVNRVGFGELLRLVGAATAAGLVERSLTNYGIQADRLRESLLLHALASEALASHTEVDTRMAYAGGLLRALGMMVLDRAARGRLEPGDGYDAARFASYHAWENARFGITNPEAATMMLDDWRFPAEMVAAIGEHLLAEGAGMDDPLAVVVNLAGAIVAQKGLALQGEQMHWEVTADKLEAAGISEEQFEMAAAEAWRVFEQQKAALY